MDDSAPRWPFLRPLPAAELLRAAITLAALVAERHALGEAGGVEEAYRAPDGQPVLGPADPDLDPAEDVRSVARLIMESALIRMPPAPPHLSDEHLLAHLALVCPDVSPDLMAVLADACAPDPLQRPADGVALWARLQLASALAQIRREAPHPRRVVWSVGHDSHIGLYKSRLRQVNEDALYYQVDGDLALLLVADGISISTAGSGNLASALLVQVASSMWEQHRDMLHHAAPEALERFLVDTLALANEAVCSGALRLAGGSLGQHIPMGTTVVAVLARGAEALIASLGDSRVYLVGSQGAALLTGDQNLRGEYLRAWQGPTPVPLHGDGHALVGYVGHFDANGQPAAIRPPIRRLRVLPGEALVLCSDGLNDYAAESHAEMGRMLVRALREEDLSAVARELVGRANAGGGGDNVTVVCARLSHLP